MKALAGLQRSWVTLAGRERVLVSLAGAIVVLGLLWLWHWLRLCGPCGQHRRRVTGSINNCRTCR